MIKYIFNVVIIFATFEQLQAAPEPVTYGGDDVVDACSSFGHVHNLSNTADGFLAVKEAPQIKSKRVDKIYNKQNVWVCSESKDGQWFGIVYTKDSKIDCQVTKPVKTKTTYTGPCKSGWVSSKWITIDAG